MIRVTENSPAFANVKAGLFWQSMVLIIRKEDLFDLFIEQFGDLESQWQTGVIFFGLDGVNGLARDVELVGQVCL